MESLFNIALAAEDPATWLVCLLGVTVVFVGLICIIGILYLMNFIIGKMESGKETKADVHAATPATPVQAAGVPIENRREIIAAVCAAVAEEEGTDISAIRVISFKKL
ncbi:MAG: OadG family protein [Clostridia bacterium]|nr:OadG family protein [Clostridia bacterium]